MSICPRCKRPLEDEEAYICCAGVELRWRCAACHKVSVGFAFPYGMCPHCKGQLELLDRAAIFAGVDRRPEDPANLFRIAIAFEQRAVDFFTREGERAPAGSVESELYKELAAEEREHVALLSTEYRRWEAGKAGIL